MKISYKWLKDFVDLDGVCPNKLAELLTNSGFEIEEVYKVADASGLVIGKVVDCKAHEESDHLKITKVDIGTEVLDIVCGANNCTKDIKVIVAKIGAKLMGNEIKKTKIRGVESHGMLCSLKELGVDKKRLSEKQLNGIEILDDEAEVGNEKVLEFLGLDDVILEGKPTPNRPDLLSMFAIAYEVGAILKKDVSIPDYFERSKNGIKTSFKLSLETDKCKAFNGKVVNKIKVSKSPDFIRERLNNCGIKSINNVVDISNYVMLETGQPLHFYDLKKLKKQEIKVVQGFETDYVALDGITYKIQKDDILITSDNEIIGIAGIMGGYDSMIDEKTDSIFIEAAIFDSASVRNSSRRLNLNTEASLRFSKGVEKLNPIKAVDRAIMLLEEYADAKGCEENVFVGENDFSEAEVSISLKKLNDILGTDFLVDEVLETFKYLNFNPQYEDGVFKCQIPTYRQDIKIANDLAEEVIRLMGFSRLKESFSDNLKTIGKLNYEQKMIRQTKDIFNGYGLDEIVTYTLVDKNIYEDGLMRDLKPYELLIPLSEKRCIVRESLMGSVLECASYNKARKVEDINIFEISNFNNKQQNYTRLGIYLEGSLAKSNILKFDIKSDFYALKALMIGYLDKLGINNKRLSFRYNDLEKEKFYPYKSALIYIDKKLFGVFGFLHPDILKKYDLDESVYGEFKLDVLFEIEKEKVYFKSLDRFPSSKRDLSIVVKEEVNALDVLKVIKSSSKYVKDLKVFDVYRGQHIEENYKSLAISITYNGKDHTMGEEEINSLHSDILKLLEEKFKANLRR